MSVVPTLYVIKKSSEVLVSTTGYNQPSEFYWVLANGIDKKGTFSDREMIAQRLKGSKFVIDLKEGEHILNIQAVWTSYTDMPNASYNYHIKVV